MMTAFAAGARVVVHSFGAHHGEVLGPGIHAGWVEVRLDTTTRQRGRIWRGHVDHLQPEPAEPAPPAGDHDAHP